MFGKLFELDQKIFEIVLAHTRSNETVLLKVTEWILLWLISNKNRRNFHWIEKFLSTKKLKKIGVTILPGYKQELPSYHGINNRGCQSWLKSIDHTLTSLAWKFESHIYYSFGEKQISLKKIKRLNVTKNHLSVNFFISFLTFKQSPKYVKYTKSTNFWAAEKYISSFKRPRKDAFKGNIFENGDWIYFHQKPESNPRLWCVNEKYENKWSVIKHEKGLENDNLEVVFSESLTETIIVKKLELTTNIVWKKMKFFEKYWHFVYFWKCLEKCYSRTIF